MFRGIIVSWLNASFFILPFLDKNMSIVHNTMCVCVSKHYSLYEFPRVHGSASVFLRATWTIAEPRHQLFKIPLLLFLTPVVLRMNYVFVLFVYQFRLYSVHFFEDINPSRPSRLCRLGERSRELGLSHTGEVEL